jgi:hypothetical protein
VIIIGCLETSFGLVIAVVPRRGGTRLRDSPARDQRDQLGLVGGAFVWDLFGALLGAPHWLIDLSLFQDVGLVPAEPSEQAPRSSCSRSPGPQSSDPQRSFDVATSPAHDRTPASGSRGCTGTL